LYFNLQKTFGQGIVSLAIAIGLPHTLQNGQPFSQALAGFKRKKDSFAGSSLA